MSKTITNVAIGIMCAVLVVIMCVCGIKLLFGSSMGVNYSLYKKANDFNIYRKITVMNVRTDEVMMQMQGYISISDNSSNELVITTKTGENSYSKNYIYLNDWTCYVVEQIEPDDSASNEVVYYPSRLCGGDQS